MKYTYLLSLVTLLAFLINSNIAYGNTYHYYHDHDHGGEAAAGMAGFTMGTIVGASAASDSGDPVAREEARTLKEERLAIRDERKAAARRRKAEEKEARAERKARRKAEKRARKNGKIYDAGADDSEQLQELRDRNKKLEEQIDKLTKAIEDLKK